MLFLIMFFKLFRREQSVTIRTFDQFHLGRFSIREEPLDPGLGRSRRVAIMIVSCQSVDQF